MTLEPERIIDPDALAGQALYSMKETARLLGIGLTTVKKMIRDGEIRTVKLRARRLVPGTEISRIASSHSQNH